MRAAVCLLDGGAGTCTLCTTRAMSHLSASFQGKPGPGMETDSGPGKCVLLLTRHINSRPG